MINCGSSQTKRTNGEGSIGWARCPEEPRTTTLVPRAVEVEDADAEERDPWHPEVIQQTRRVITPRFLRHLTARMGGKNVQKGVELVVEAELAEEAEPGGEERKEAGLEGGVERQKRRRCRIKIEMELLRRLERIANCPRSFFLFDLFDFFC